MSQDRTVLSSLPASSHCDLEDTLWFLALTLLNTNVPPDLGWPKPLQRMENSEVFFLLWNDIKLNPMFYKGVAVGGTGRLVPGTAHPLLAQCKWSHEYQPLL